MHNEQSFEITQTGTPESASSPEAGYRKAFLRSLLRLAPKKVLDAGCGRGQLLAELGAHRIDAIGVDISPEAIAACHAQGTRARLCNSESLPFDDGAFDWVVSQYVAHHLASPQTVTREMLRVARCGVLILDVWYDPSISAGACARKLDRLLKQIDQENGEIHLPVLDVNQVAGDLIRSPAIAWNVEYWQRGQFRTTDQISSDIEAALLRSSDPDAARDAWKDVCTISESVGLLDEGAIFIQLRKIGAESPVLESNRRLGPHY